MAVTDRLNGAATLGFEPGQVVQEFGYDDDADQGLRDLIEEITGEHLVDEDYDGVCDVALVWWRDFDGDLTDTLVDALTVLEDGGVVWVLTPKAGREGHIEPAEIDEAATVAGLHATSSVAAAPEWSGIRLAPRGRGR